ncbi:MAG: hypothetical protein WBY84_25505, partial [Pseudolabrys sp.]
RLKRRKPMLDQAIAFGNFRLEPNGGLMSGAREVRLTPKALELLHEGRIVRRRVAQERSG